MTDNPQPRRADRVRTCWLVEGRVCPKCGRAIIRNSREEWCARGQEACDYRAKVEGGQSDG